VLTDIPLGAWTVAVVLDALDEINTSDGFGRGAEAAVTIGLAGAVGAAVTGLADWEQLDGQPRRVGLLHGLLNTTAALLYARSLHLRKRRQRRAGRGFALLGYTVSLAAAYLGGKLVYEERIGVNRALGHLPASTATWEFIPVLPEAELPENVLRRVDVAGAPLLLVRRGARVFTLAETCSHLSGPLAEGQLDGESVVCPWHGSRFALTDGRVVNGPATHPQPCFVARVCNGQIEIRLPGRTPVSGEQTHGKLP
jgi:nitrite reductase/ring-hydroxylating ferredoxin subunit